MIKIGKTRDRDRFQLAERRSVLQETKDPPPAFAPGDGMLEIRARPMAPYSELCQRQLWLNVQNISDATAPEQSWLLKH